MSIFARKVELADTGSEAKLLASPVRLCQFTRQYLPRGALASPLPLAQGDAHAGSRAARGFAGS